LSIAYSEQKEQIAEVVPEKKIEEKKVVEKDKNPTNQVVKVDPKKKEVKPQTPKKEPIKKASAKVHIVKKGDTLYGLAAKYKTSVAQLKKVNKLKSDSLQIGQKLSIP
jgi:LysM repeat protein